MAAAGQAACRWRAGGYGARDADLRASRARRRPGAAGRRALSHHGPLHAERDEHLGCRGAVADRRSGAGRDGRSAALTSHKLLRMSEPSTARTLRPRGPIPGTVRRWTNWSEFGRYVIVGVSGYAITVA